jgi:hypothetical protein
MRAAIVALAALVLATAPLARAGDDPFERGLWPFWTGDALPWAGLRETRALGPLYERVESDGATRWAARPFVSRRIEPERRRWDVLFPLAARDESAERDEAWVLLYLHRERERTSPRSELRTGISFRSTNADGTRSSGLFPFYGTLRGRLGMDEIRFVLFPLFARGRKGGYRETHLLWPFFSRGSGDGRSQLRLWPLFGFDHNAGRWRRAFWLWPFVHRSEKLLDSERPERSLWIVPLYGWREIGTWQTRCWLFPLLSYQWDRADPTPYAMDVLWPLWSSSDDGRGTRGFALRPLWWQKQTPESWRGVGLLGLVGRERVFGDDLRESSWQLAWASGIGQRQQGYAEQHWADVWPLFRARWSRDPEGAERARLSAPFVLPMRGLDPDGWRTHWNGLFELYRREMLEGERRSSWLFGLHESRERPGETWHSFGGLLHLRFDD